VCHDSSMRHNLPPIPAFRDASPTDPIQEMALRVVVELPGWELRVLGTATLIGGFLAVTAKHVIDVAISMFGAKQRGPKNIEIEGYSLRLYQVLPGPIYRVWNVFKAWICPSDIAILHLGLDRTSEPDGKVEWRALQLRVVPPPSGQKVLAFGYRESTIEVTEGADGTHHIVLNDVGTTSIGEVGQIFPERRDSSMLTFPCFEVYARFAPGMSGGLIIDEDGALCGLVCAGTSFADPSAPPLSYAATLWPMLTTMISADRGDAYPRGVEYPMIDLALDKLIHTIGLGELDPALFPGRTLPRTQG
jgi:Trypsin-like peptidase domain